MLQLRPSQRLLILTTSKIFHPATTSFIGIVLLALSPTSLLAATLPTTTNLQISSSSVESGEAVTLTANVAADKPVTPGQVIFCNASAPHCEDAALLGLAQLTSNGTASTKLRLGIGSHSIKAIFLGTTVYSRSTAEALTVDVRPATKLSTTTTINQSVNSGSLALSATVTGLSTAVLSGEVSFFNPNNNSSFGIASLSSVAHSFAPVLPGITPPHAFLGEVTADLNNDGLTDFFITDPIGNVVDVYLTDPANPGKFQSPTTYPTGEFPDKTAVGDFNNDGVQDMVISNNSNGIASTTLSVLLGDVSHPGRFLSQVQYVINSPATALVVTDLNHDGLPDIAVSRSDFPSGVVGIFLDNSQNPGTFLPEKTFKPSQFPSSVVSGDLNGDGLSDLVIGDSNFNLVVLLNDPAHPGQFLSPISYSAGAFLDPPLVADLNADGLPDLAILDAQSPSVKIALNDAEKPGTFLPAVSYHTSSRPSGLVAGDFNGDGAMDLVTGGGTHGPTLFPGNPAQPGQFLSPVVYPVGISGSLIVTGIGDFNGDGLSDAQIEFANGNSVSLGIVPGESISTATLSNIKPGTGAPRAEAIYGGDTNYIGSRSAVINLTNATAPAPGATTIN